MEEKQEEKATELNNVWPCESSHFGVWGGGRGEHSRTQGRKRQMGMCKREQLPQRLSSPLQNLIVNGKVETWGPEEGL